MAAPTRRVIPIFFIVIALLMVAVGLYIRNRPTEPPFPYGEIRIAIDASTPPFALANGSDLTGLEIDLGYALGEELGLTVRFINMGYDGLYDSLRADQADIVLSQLVINPLKMGDVLYTRPYFDAGLVLISNTSHSINEMSALSGKRLAYEFGSSADAEARLWARRIRPFETLPYELPEHALDSIRLGEADAALVDAISARIYLREHRDWQVQVIYVTHIPFAIATSIDRPQTWQVIDRALQALIQNGTLDRIINRWL